MKKILIILMASVVIISGLGYLRVLSDTRNGGSGGRALGPPKIAIAPQYFDFGKVKYGDIVTTTLKLKNEGGSDLEINRVSTSCGCTKAEVDKNTVSPREEIDLIVSFEPAIHKDDTDLGDVTRVVYIKSNDPDTSELEVKITANVYKE